MDKLTEFKTQKIKYSQLTPYERRQIREQYVTSQRGKCMFCKKSLFGEPPSEITDRKIDWSYFPDNFLKYPIHLQHNHITGEIEGAVHAYCNAVMWQYYGK